MYPPHRSTPYGCFFFNDPATTEIYTLSLHDALPIWVDAGSGGEWTAVAARRSQYGQVRHDGDRKSTRLNSSHTDISYAVFFLKNNSIQLRCFGAPSFASTQCHCQKGDSRA